MVLAGRESGSIPLGGVYDLSEYLFPKQTGTVVYQLFASEKPKDESSFSDETHQDDVQYAIDREGTSVTVSNKAGTGDVARYTIAVGGKQFQTVVETREEKYAAKDVRVIQSEQTTCEYTKVDSNTQADGGCTRKTCKIWTFVAE